MDVVIVGSGRAAGAVVLASVAAGHRVAGVLSRRPQDLGPALSWDSPLPEADLGIIAVTDSAIVEVAQRLAPHWRPRCPAVHLSGLTSVNALDPLDAVGAPTGSLHPLQSLPDAQRGAAALAGAWAALTSNDAGLLEALSGFAASLGLRPFVLADEAKPVYHAAASAASNYVVESLAVAADLLAAAHVDLEVVEPLTRQVVANVFAIGPDAALTGPIARGDQATVSAQLAAAEGVSESVGRQFRFLAEATATRVGLEL